MYDHIIVAGNGNTSRANVEALVDDYIYANPGIKFTLYNHAKLSEGQVWLKQYLADKDIEHEVILGGAVEDEARPNTAMFILWDDEDPESANLLAVAKENDFPAFDLTDGLHQLHASDTLKVTPVVELPEHDNLEEDDEEYDEWDDDDGLSDEVIVGEALLYAAVNTMAEIFAQAIARELKKALKK